MKKFLFLLTFISCVLNAGDSKLFNTDNINNEYTKKYLVGMENFNFTQTVIIKDFFEHP